MNEQISKFHLIIWVLLISQLCIGLAIIFVTATFQFLLASFVVLKEMRILSSQFLYSYLVGLQLFIISLCCLRMWTIIWKRPYSTSIQLLLTMWLLLSFVVVLCSCAAVWFIICRVDEVTENVSTVLFRGIDLYHTNSEWKLLWDEMQYRHKCCGVHEYLDWMSASWMSKFTNEPTNSTIFTYEYYEQQIVDSLRKLRSESEQNENVLDEPKAPEKSEFTVNTDSFEIKSKPILAPYSCCIHDNLQCHRSYMPIRSDYENVSELKLSDIYTGGCLTLFRHRMLWFINALQFFIVANVLMHIFICCLTRVLMFKTCKDIYRESDNNFSFCDDDGNVLVVVKCAPKVKWITMEENQSLCDSDLLYISSDTDTYVCYCQDNLNDNTQNNIIMRERSDILLH